MNVVWKLTALAAAVTLVAGCGTRATHTVVREQPVVVQQQAPQPVVVERVTVVQPPAAPQEVAPPAPATGYSWVAGHHVWQDGRWVWRPGQWVAGTVRPLPAPMTEAQPAPPSDAPARWVPGYWNWGGNDWVWVRGRWM